jgi:steroid delta-isomerase-like uncharacterized protein
MDFDGYVRAINAHDWDAIVSFMTDDVVYEDITLGERHQGAQSVKEFWRSAATDFSSDFRMEVLRSFGTATDFAAEWVFKGTHDGTNPQLAATGKQFAVRGVSIGRIEGGRIKENKDVWNMAEFLSQVGLMTAPA